MDPVQLEAAKALGLAYLPLIKPVLRAFAPSCVDPLVRADRVRIGCYQGADQSLLALEWMAPPEGARLSRALSPHLMRDVGTGAIDRLEAWIQRGGEDMPDSLREFQAILEMMRTRAFQGSMLLPVSDGTLTLRWEDGERAAEHWFDTPQSSVRFAATFDRGFVELATLLHLIGPLGDLGGPVEWMLGGDKRG